MGYFRATSAPHSLSELDNMARPPTGGSSNLRCVSSTCAQDRNDPESAVFEHIVHTLKQSTITHLWLMVCEEVSWAHGLSPELVRVPVRNVGHLQEITLNQKDMPADSVEDRVGADQVDPLPGDVAEWMVVFLEAARAFPVVSFRVGRPRPLPMHLAFAPFDRLLE
ncbi:hypothetical protein OF83DRAFT_1285486, partial [Amylostereum chailletii]